MSTERVRRGRVSYAMGGIFLFLAFVMFIVGLVNQPLIYWLGSRSVVADRCGSATDCHLGKPIT